MPILQIPIVGEGTLVEFNEGDMPVPYSPPRMVTIHTTNVTLTEEELSHIGDLFSQSLRNAERERLIRGNWDVVREPSIFSEEAKEKAKHTLLDNLTEVQRNQYLREGYFCAFGSISNERYKIYPKRAWAIYLERAMGLFPDIAICATTNGKVPIEDEMLINKLMIENNEKEFLFRSNFDPMYAKSDFLYYIETAERK